MATKQDYEKCAQVWPEWARECRLPLLGRILMCSPDRTQFRLVQEFATNCLLMSYDKRDWNLNEPWGHEPVDIVIACNVFHYSPDPFLWFNNCLRACRYLWIQDIFSRPRGPDGTELSKIDVGDATRFGYGNVFSTNAPVDTMFDLNRYQDRIKGIEFYDAGSLEAGRAMINFIAMFRGDIE